MKRMYGCLPSPYDERDYTASSYLAGGAVELPKSFKLHNLPDAIYDQGGTMKCVAYALKLALEVCNKFDMDQYIPMSVDYIFSNRYPDQGSYHLLTFEGSYPRDIIQSVQRGGACEDNFFKTRQPDDFPMWNEMLITDEMRKNAEKYKIATYLRIRSDYEIQLALVTLNTPVLISIPVTNKFIGGYNEQITAEFANENSAGLHMIAVVGYAEHNGINYFECINSWGKEWGEYGGHFFLPFGYPFKEAWSITDKVLQHWAAKYYDYLKSFGIEINEKGFDIPATRGKCFEYFAKVLGYKGDDSYDAYWNYLNKYIVVYDKAYERNISRAETFAMIARLHGIHEPVTHIKGAHWGEVYWKYLNAHGVKIYDKDYERNVTRAEVMALLSRLKGFIEPNN